MKKKLLYIDKYLINHEMLVVDELHGYTNELFSLLNQFGITDPGAIKDPITYVHEKLKESMPTQGIETPIANILKLINKEKEYKAIIHVSNRVQGHKYIELLDYVDGYFRVKPTALLTITDKLTPYITDPDQIEFANRIEKFVDEAYNLSEQLGISLGGTDFYRTFKAYRVDGKTLLWPVDHLTKI